MKHPYLLLLLFVLVSCKSHSVVQRGSTAVQDSSISINVVRAVDTVVVRDSVYRHDSIVHREVVRHDTVYITKEVYRNANHSTLNAQHSTKTDTIHIVEYRDRVVEHPPERYVPKFYKTSTILFYILLLMIVVCVFMKFR